ncbi:MAG: thioredoxin fold domain-containing protein [Microscillaceae bacterium]|jgi:thioredoxin-related protein|nr:thioredoxin fold domain-containing protein [Microscillaceae bacterium]
MKNCAVLLLVLFQVLTLEIPAQNRKIKFESLTFAQALAKAKAEKKFIFMDAFTTWCGPCKMLDKKVFTNDSIADFYNQHFVNLKVDMEKGEGIELGKKYGVDAFPTLLFIEANAATVAYKLIGYMPAAQLLREGQRMVDPQKNPDAIKQRYAQNKQNLNNVRDYLEILQNEDSTKADIIDDYWAKLSDDQKLKPENFQLVKQFLTSKNSPAFSEIMQKRAEYEKLFTKDSVDAMIESVYQMEIFYGEGSQGPTEYKQVVDEFLTLNTKHKKRLEVSYTINLLMMEGKNQEIPTYVHQYVQNDLLKSNPPPTQELANYLFDYANLVQYYSTDNQLLTSALDWLTRAEKIKPNNPLYTERKALVLKQLGRNQEALSSANQAIELFKASPEEKPSVTLQYVVSELKTTPVVMGYQIKKDKITFSFQASDYQYLVDGATGSLLGLDTVKIDRVSVAGSFNDWQPNAEGFTLSKNASGIYQLTKDLKSIAQNQPVEFKFVVNDNQWVTPAPKARNKKAASPEAMLLNGNMLIEEKIK